MGGLEDQLAEYSLWGPLSKKGYKKFVPIGRSVSETGELLAEVYKAFSPIVNDIVTLKVIIGGKVAERDAVANVAAKNKLETILTQYMTDTVVLDGKQAVIIPYKYVEGQSLEQRAVGAEEFRKQALKLANDLYVIQKERFALADIRPSNILIDSEGRPYFIDFDACVRFGDLLHRETEGFTHGSLGASEQTDTYSFLKTIQWVAKKNKFSGNSTFTQLIKATHEWEVEGKAVTLEKIIEILGEPERQQEHESRRSFVKKTVGTAVAVTAGGTFLTCVYNRSIYKDSENAALDAMKNPDGSINASRSMQQQLGRALARKMGDLVEEGVFSFIGSIQTIGRYNPDGTIFHVEAFHPHAGAVTEGFYLASTVDKRTLPVARAAAQAQVDIMNRMGTEAFAYADSRNRNTWNLRYAYEDTGDIRYLDAMFKSTEAALKHVRPHSRLLMPWSRGAKAIDENKPIVVYDDSNNLFALRGGLYVQQKIVEHSIKEREAYLQVDIEGPLRRFSETLQQLTEDNRVKMSITYEVDPPFRSPYSPAHSQADVAYALYEAGVALQDVALQNHAAMLVEPLLANPLIKRFGMVEENPVTKRMRQSTDKHNYGALARAFRQAKMQRPGRDYSTILGILHPHIPRAEFEGSAFKKPVRKQKELLSDVCLPLTGWCPIGHPQSDADLLYALLV